MRQEGGKGKSIDVGGGCVYEKEERRGEIGGERVCVSGCVGEEEEEEEEVLFDVRVVQIQGEREGEEQGGREREREKKKKSNLLII